MGRTLGASTSARTAHDAGWQACERQANSPPLTCTACRGDSCSASSAAAAARVAAGAMQRVGAATGMLLRFAVRVQRDVVGIGGHVCRGLFQEELFNVTSFDRLTHVPATSFSRSRNRSHPTLMSNQQLLWARALEREQPARPTTPSSRGQPSGAREGACTLTTQCCAQAGTMLCPQHNARSHSRVSKGVTGVTAPHVGQVRRDR